MTTTYSYSEIPAIEAEAWRAFDCHQMPRGKGARERVAKRNKVSKTTRRFFDVINGPNPPRSKEEAVQMITPALAMLLSIFFKQFVVMVIEWLWDRTQQKQVAE